MFKKKLTSHKHVVRMNISLRIKVETYQTFSPCRMAFFIGRMAGHMTLGSRDKSWSRTGDLVASVSVEGRGFLVNA